MNGLPQTPTARPTRLQAGQAGPLARTVFSRALSGVGLLLVLLAPHGLSAAPDAAGEGSPLQPADLITRPQAVRKAFGKLIRRGGVIVGDNGRVVFSYRRGRYVPASIIKLATALTAFHELGETYRFPTRIYRWKGWLYIQGFGDPFMVSEEWRSLAGALRAKGAFKRNYRGIVLDGTVFAPNQLVHGATDTLNPYDAKLGALVSNFNTVFVTVRGRGRRKRVTSAEPQTPLTPIARTLGGRLQAGSHRINLSAMRIEGIRYTGELTRAIFTEAGGRFADASRPGKVPTGAILVLEYRSSRDLHHLVRDMMQFSNNFIANQLVMAISRKGSGVGGEKGSPKPARLAEGVQRIQRYLVRELGLSPGDFTLVEGSGISPRNTIRLTAMLKIVDAFYPRAGLLKPFGTPPRVVPAKTGTLTGVYSLAGFLPAPPGVRRPFVIILNQPRYTRKKVFEILWDAYRDRDKEAAAKGDAGHAAATQ